MRIPCVLTSNREVSLADRSTASQELNDLLVSCSQLMGPADFLGGSWAIRGFGPHLRSVRTHVVATELWGLDSFWGFYSVVWDLWCCNAYVTTRWRVPKCRCYPVVGRTAHSSYTRPMRSPQTGNGVITVKFNCPSRYVWSDMNKV